MKYRNLTLSQVKKLAVSLYKKSGPKNRIFGLIGPLGSGKTTFTQALAGAMGIKKAKSPTFIIIHCYTNKSESLYHIDLYRLEKDKELRALDLDEILEDRENVVVIEWVNKFPRLLKKCHTIIEFETLKDNLRNVTITNN